MAAGTYGTMYYVDDMKRSAAYFRKLLGRKPRYASAEWTEFDQGGHALCLHAKERGKRYRPNGVLILSRPRVRALFASMKKKRLKAGGLHEVHPGAWTFTLTDPSGNEVSIYGSP